MNDNELVKIINNNNLVRYITSRSYFYLYRRKEDESYITYYNPSPLLDEILDCYSRMSKENRNSYVAKDKQKAE